MNVYRILKKPYWDDPLSVIGAERFPGRWNPLGVGLLYTASSPSLCLLETMVHLPDVDFDELPGLRLFTLQLAEESVRYIDPDSLPTNWQKAEKIAVTQHFFETWLEQPDKMTLALPSAVVPVSYIYLHHPKHPDFSSIQVVSQTALSIDKRLWRR